MVRIGNADQAMALVRAQLERMARNKRSGRTDEPENAEKARVSDESRLHAVGMLGDLSREEFEKVLVRSLLSQEFGEGVSNDARFHEIVDQTMRVLRADPAMVQLMGRASASVLKQ